MTDGKSAKRIGDMGFSHPCKETCSGWMQGYDEGFDAGLKAKLPSDEEIENAARKYTEGHFQADVRPKTSADFEDSLEYWRDLGKMLLDEQEKHSEQLKEAHAAGRREAIAEVMPTIEFYGEPLNYDTIIEEIPVNGTGPIEIETSGVQMDRGERACALKEKLEKELK